MPNNGMKNYIYRIINSTKLKNPLYYGHAPNLNSILNKLSVSKNCSKRQIEDLVKLYENEENIFVLGINCL